MENTIYFELIRRGYRVYIGKTGKAEVDFAAQKNGEIFYYQVSASLLDPNTFERELLPLRSIKDNYKKTVLTLDPFTQGNYEGIRVVYAIDWLLQE